MSTCVYHPCELRLQDTAAKPASDSDESAAAEAPDGQQPAAKPSVPPPRPSSGKSAAAKRRKKKRRQEGGGKTADSVQPDGLAAEEDLDSILAELNLSRVTCWVWRGQAVCLPRHVILSAGATAVRSGHMAWYGLGSQLRW